jgi:hypothetical protein
MVWQLDHPSLDHRSDEWLHDSPVPENGRRRAICLSSAILLPIWHSNGPHSQLRGAKSQACWQIRSRSPDVIRKQHTSTRILIFRRMDGTSHGWFSKLTTPYVDSMMLSTGFVDIGDVLKGATYQFTRLDHWLRCKPSMQNLTSRITVGRRQTPSLQILEVLEVELKNMQS